VLSEYPTRMVRQCLTCLGGYHPPAASFKQNDTGIPLDGAVPLARRRQCEICLSGSGCNAAGIDHTNEQAQIREIESHSLTKADSIREILTYDRLSLRI
jgi:hypothetical protein